MKAFWHKCSVEGCEEVCVSSEQYGVKRTIKCAKHRRQDEVEKAVDRSWESSTPCDEQHTHNTREKP